MTFLPSSTLISRSRVLILGSLTLMTAAVVSGCADNHVGRPCDIGVPKQQIDSTKVTVNPAALECPSRICLLPAQDSAPVNNIAGLCTVECSSDDDCSDGEKGSNTPGNTRCLSGFVCRTLLPRLSTNGLGCKPLCVCKDFLSTADSRAGTLPDSCKNQP
jgi:hypothetical protein